MNKLCTVVFAALSAAVLQAATVDRVIVRQQWPWKTDIKVEYMLSGVTKPVDLTVKAFDGDTELALPTSAITGDLWGVDKDGPGELTIDPVAAFGADARDIAKFSVQILLSDSSELSTEVIYKIFDLRTGACQDVRRADFYNGKMGDRATTGAYETDYTQYTIHPDWWWRKYSTNLKDVFFWTGVTNDVKYAKDYLVMRLVKAKGETFSMGSPADQNGHGGNEAIHPVQLTNDFYIAVFEFTVYQHDQENVRPTDSSAIYREYATYNESYGDKKLMPCWGSKGYVRGTDWPNDHTVLSGRVLGRLRALTGDKYQWDLPTEAQWEFACRAGTTTTLSDGYGYDADVPYTTGVGMVGWTGGDSDSSYHPVGRKRPNALGLYDMLGNAWESVLDRYDANYGLTSEQMQVTQVNPVGPASGDGETYCGASSLQYGTSAKRSDNSYGWIGFRPVFIVP